MSDKSISVIIVNYNTAHLLEECLSKLQVAAVFAGVVLDVLIVDNASRDNSKSVLLEKYSSFKLTFSDVNVGFGRANNLMLPHVSGEYVLLLNTDAFVEENSLKLSLEYLRTNPGCGLVGARLLSRDGSVQASARYFPTPLKIFFKKTGLDKLLWFMPKIDPDSLDFDVPTECDWVPGCYYLLRKKVVDQVGLFDPRYFLYYEEVDNCFAIRKAGWKVVALPNVNVVHIGGESAKSDGAISGNGKQLESLLIESEQLYFRKNLGVFWLVTHVLLDIFAELVIFLKLFGHGRGKVAFFSMVSRQKLLITSLLRTRLGSQATR